MKDLTNLFDWNLYTAKRGQVPKYEINNAMLVFDVVGWSAKPVNESMIETVGDIQNCMWDALNIDYYWGEREEHADKNGLLLVPTGDGYGIAVSNQFADEKILDIAGALCKRFSKEKLKVRMGIAKGRNVLTVDLNDNLNIFGYGIVLAHRVCAAASTGQILVHAALAESLLEQRTINELQKIPTAFESKHGLQFLGYNYFKKGDFGININIGTNTGKKK